LVYALAGAGQSLFSLMQMQANDLKVEVKSERHGFTIAELLLVVVVIALIGGVGGGLYVGTYKRLLVEKAARDLLLTAQYARIAAIEQLRPYEIQLDVENKGFWLATSRLNAETGQTEQSIVKNYYCKPVEFTGDVKFEDVQITPIGTETTTEAEDRERIVFSPNGNAQFAVIQIGDGKTHFTVSIAAATGKAAMHFGKAENVKIKTIDLDSE
jgi:prepilin-type N-terminal cleavage/methylation domain-containing protein